MRWNRLSVCGGLICFVAILGCVEHPSMTQSSAASDLPDKNDGPKAVPEAKRIAAGKNLVLELQGGVRRVRIAAEVCNREKNVFLEQLLTRKFKKEHEAILAADIDVRQLHAALTLAGAEPGKPMQFRPKLVPASGTAVKIFVEYKTKDGKEVRMPAQQWIVNKKTGKTLQTDWVFAGSVLIPDPSDKDKPPFYGANEGDVITVVNFESSCLDVPFISTKDTAEDFVPNTDLIPAVKTAVTVVLEPVLEKKKK